jgi:quinol monooxygenase YgiN
MYVIRDIFRCKPGKAKDLAARFKQLVPSMTNEDGFTNMKVMVDAVANYWTVVLEAECETLSQFESHMSGFGQRAEVRQVMDGYMDLVDGGHREIYRLI